MLLVVLVGGLIATQHPLGWTQKMIELSYVELASACQNARAASGLLNVSSVGDCESLCDQQAAAAPGTGEAPCLAVDSNSQACYLKSEWAPSQEQGAVCEALH